MGENKKSVIEKQAKEKHYQNLNVSIKLTKKSDR
jgi:hypothetical protein